MCRKQFDSSLVGKKAGLGVAFCQSIRWYDADRAAEAVDDVGSVRIYPEGGRAWKKEIDSVKTTRFANIRGKIP